MLEEVINAVSGLSELLRMCFEVFADFFFPLLVRGSRFGDFLLDGLDFHRIVGFNDWILGSGILDVLFGGERGRNRL